MFPAGRKIPVLGGKLPYYKKVLATRGSNIAAYWPLWDVAGSAVITDVSPQANNGAPGAGAKAPTFGAAGIGDGKTAMSFDGGDYGDLFSAALASDFSGTEGTISVWVKNSNWAAVNVQRICVFARDANNIIRIYKNNANALLYQYFSNSVNDNVSQGGVTSTGWLHVAMTWSASADQLKAYLSGSQAGATQSTLGAFGGAITSAYVGANDTTPTLPWNGSLAHLAVWNVPLTPGEIAKLAVV